MGRRKSNNKNNTITELSDALILNGQAMREGPRQKKWSKHDLKAVKPLTPTQEAMFHDFIVGKNIVAHGTAGTGKSFIALYLAFNELFRESKPRRVIIVRSAVATRDIGFMPGTLEEKTAVYERPYVDMLGLLFGRYSTYQDMKDLGVVEFQTTSFLRGLTWDDAIIVVDECQNMTFHEINSIMTRLGMNSRIIFTGDAIQSDLNKRTDKPGIDRLIKVTETMEQFSVIKFTRYDIVRSDIVRAWIEACEDIPE